jgi:RsiW-degrading membrane proteinase PrsW (M82 family)
MTELSVVDWRALLIVAGFAFAPGLFWLWYFYEKDLEPEPLYRIRNCFFAGMAVVIPAGLIEKSLGMSQFLTLTIVAPVVEECLKLGACFIVAYRGKDFDEPMDGIIYAVAIALGFASLENVFYLYDAYSLGPGIFPITTVVRAFFTVPGHAIFGIMWGYAMGRAKFSDHKTSRDLILKGLCLAIASHAIFNLLAVLTPFWAIGMLIFIPVVWGLANRKMVEAVEYAPHTGKAKLALQLEALKKRLRIGAGSGQWFDNRVTVVLLLFFLFFPVGLYALYKSTTLSRPEKAAYLVLWGLWIGLLGINKQ